VTPRNFAVIGAAGFIAPRHLEAIRATGHRLVAATDPHDSVGILDRYGFGVRFFPEIERFDRHLEKLRRQSDDRRVHYVSVCTPNYLHDAHIRLALRVGADAICEKPLVINPWNLDVLEQLESETGARVHTVLQLRLHPELQRLRARIMADGGSHSVQLTYVTARGAWYDVSWKGSAERSGGIATNIGIHFFDLLLWLFGDLHECEVHVRDARRIAGSLQLQRARVTWFLSTDPCDVPHEIRTAGQNSFRSIVVDGEEADFTDGITGLHNRVYEEVLAGRGFGIAAARPAIELAYKVRHACLRRPTETPHPAVTTKAFQGQV
jgi:UDP-N-acetyl-2-amino-2-deoxyglucuronate dehydrogenase